MEEDQVAMELEQLYELVQQQILVSAISVLIGAIGAAVGGFFAGKYKERKHAKQERDDIEHARIVIEKATARRLIFEAYTNYCIDGKHMTIDRKREIDETFEAYTLLGGNGTAKKYYDEISKVAPFLVMD